MHNLLMDKVSLSQVFLSLEPMEALKVKNNIDWSFNELSLPSDELLADMKAQGISLPDTVSKSKKLDIGAINDSVLHKHLSELFLDKHKLYNVLCEFSLLEQVTLRSFLTSLETLLHLPSSELIDRMQNEGVLATLLGEDDKAASVKQKIEALSNSQRNNKLDEVKKRLANISKTQTNCPDELKVARIKANLNKATQPQLQPQPQKEQTIKDKIARLG